MKYCAIYYRPSDDGKPFHYAHRAWIALLRPHATTSFIPHPFKASIFGSGMVGQILSFIKGPFVPSADVYVVEGVASLACIAFKKGKKIVINTDTFVKQLESMTGFRKKYALWLLNKADGFISTSEMMKEMTERYSNKPNKVVYPSGDIGGFQKTVPDLGSDDICSIGASIFPKGTDILLSTFKKYEKRFPSARLYVYGTNQIKDIEKNKNVFALGRVNRDVIKAHLSKSSIYLNTARHEPFGMNIIEAMAAGLIPIVSEHCGAKTFVERVDKRLVVPLRANLFAERAIQLRNSRDISKLSRRSRKVAKEFEKESHPRRFVDAMEDILKSVNSS